MGDIIDFSGYTSEPVPDTMSRAELSEYLKSVRRKIAMLDEQEPEDMDSDEFLSWGARHEELEDLADEIQDRLDETGGSSD